MRTSTILSYLLAAGLAAGAPAANYYVNGGCGNDTWSGLSPDCAAESGPLGTIQAAINGAADGDVILVAPGTYHEQIDLLGKAIEVRGAEGAQATVIDGGGARVVTCDSGETRQTLLEGFTITGGYASQGGGMRCLASSPTVRDCIFTGNEADVAAAMRNDDSEVLVEGCSFVNNTAIVEAVVVNAHGRPAFRDCLFKNNDGQLVNAFAFTGPVRFDNCRFIDNSASVASGAIDGGGATWVNCVFSRGSATGPANSAFASASESLLINCTFSDTTGDAVLVGSSEIPTLVNCIIWGAGNESLSGYAPAAVSFSDIEGGWPGTGNIDADPLFANPGIDDVRLTAGSPCLDAGDASQLPADVLDLDDDGDTVEPVPVDVGGNPRVQGALDMGAWEGEADGAPPAAGDDDLDEGEVAILIPEGGDLDPTENPAVLVSNTAGGDDATFLVTQYSTNLHPGAGGFSELAEILVAETSLGDGAYFATVFIAFTVSGITEIDPSTVYLTYYDAATDSWAVAVAGNAADSPGHAGPAGDRSVDIDGGPWSLSGELGDHGVYWDPKSQSGFAWANVDHAGDYAVGVELCVGDCAQPPEGSVGIVDLLTLLLLWGMDHPCDLDNDGVIGQPDLLILLEAWGPCPSPSAAPSSPAAGARDRLLASWGPCAGDCPDDLDGDGNVGLSDYLQWLARPR